jgi:deoxyribonuclease V
MRATRSENLMIAALDVRYDEDALTGQGAAVVFDRSDDAVPLAEYTAAFKGVEPYVPGQFFKRELPCLLAVLEKVREPLDQIIVDGFVSLGDKPGLGMHVWEAPGKRGAVIGVAKNHFRYATPVEIVRGSSKRPIYVTAVGIDPLVAAEAIRNMHGANRVPSLLKRVDQLTRSVGALAS